MAAVEPPGSLNTILLVSLFPLKPAALITNLKKAY